MSHHVEDGQDGPAAPGPLTYSTFTIHPAELPSASVTALLRRGLAHYLGNEVSSKLISRLTARERAGHPDLSEDEKLALKAELQAEAFEALRAGTVGASSPRGPGADPMDAIRRKLALDGIRLTAKQNGLAFSKNVEGVRGLVFPDGTFKTVDELVTTRLSHPKYKEVIEKEAQAEMKARAKRADRMAALGDGVEGLDL